MKLLASVLVLCPISIIFSEYQHVLDNPLRTIEYLIGDQLGTFECIFYDISQQNPFDNVLSSLLGSPELQYVVKYVIRTPFVSTLLPKEPSLIVIYPGHEDDLKPQKAQIDIYIFLQLFHPATKVLVFVDFSEEYAAFMIKVFLFLLKFNNVVLFDTMSPMIETSTLNMNLEELNHFSNPKSLLIFFRQSLRGANISYVPETNGFWMNPNFRWLKTTAEYLKGDVHEFKKQEGGPDEADVRLKRNVSYGVIEHFQSFFCTNLEICRILVPRGRPLNVAELMVMPFGWQVWTLLLIVLSLVEIFNHFLPNLFRNDPFLLVVCGFERHNLHKTKRWEKIVLFSLIVLMFFMTNAYESKIISLMVRKPAVQIVKKLEDFDKYGLKFRYNLDELPDAKNHSVIGKYIVNGDDSEVYGNEPGLAQYVNQDLAGIIPRISYDYDRRRTWYVVLQDEVYFDSVQVHLTKLRSQYLDVFRHTHVALGEAGFYDFWFRRYADYYAWNVFGSRPPVALQSDNLLDFDDLLLAWIMLGMGYCLSFAGLIGELLSMRMKLWIDSTK